MTELEAAVTLVFFGLFNNPLFLRAETHQTEALLPPICPTHADTNVTSTYMLNEIGH